MSSMVNSKGGGTLPHPQGQHKPPAAPPLPPARQAAAPTHQALNRVTAETQRKASTATFFTTMAPHPANRPTLAPPGRFTMAGADPGGIYAGGTLSDGLRSQGVFGYAGENWASIHTERAWQLARGNEARVGGFLGGDFKNYLQLNLNAGHFHKARAIGTRAGGAVAVSAGKTSEDVSQKLTREERAKGERLVRTTHEKFRWNFNGLLGLAAFAFLRLFLRYDWKRPVTIISELRCSDADAKALTGAHQNGVSRHITERISGFRTDPKTAMASAMTLLKHPGERLEHQYAWHHLRVISPSVFFAAAGYQHQGLEQANVVIERDREKNCLQVTISRTQDNAHTVFGALPGGASVSRNRHAPGVERWRYEFNPSQLKEFETVVGAVHPERGVNVKVLNSAHLQPLRRAHAQTLSSQQSGYCVGSSISQPHWYSKGLMRNQAFGWGLTHQSGKQQSEVRVEEEGAAFIVKTSERRNEGLRGSHGVQKEILTARMIRPENDETGARTHLLLRVKHKESNATPKALQTKVLTPMSTLLGLDLGILYKNGKTPNVAGGHAYSAEMSLTLGHLRTLADYASNAGALDAAVPNARLRTALRTWIDGLPASLSTAPGAAFEALRKLMEDTADRSTDEATLLIGAIRHLLAQQGQMEPLSVKHKAALYKEPKLLAQALQARFGSEGPRLSAGLAALRQRFGAVRQAVARMEGVRQVVSQDTTVSNEERDRHKMEIDHAVRAAREFVNVPSAAQRGQLINALARTWWKSSVDRYIFDCLCSTGGAHDTREGPAWLAETLCTEWNARSAQDREPERLQLLQDLQAQNQRLADPGFPYTVQETKNLRQDLAGRIRALEAHAPQ